MTHERDIERLLDAWFDDGPTFAPDRVVDTVVDRIGRQRQRHVWRLDWRRYPMNTNVKIAATLIAVLAVAIVGYNLLPAGSTGTGSPAATPSPSPTGSPSTLSSDLFRPGLRVGAPADWQLVGDSERSVALSPTAEPSGTPHVEILVMSGPFVGAADPDCEGRVAAGVGASAAELSAALNGDPRLTATPAGSVAVGDQTGLSLDIQVAPTWTGTCAWSNGKPAALLLLATDQGPGFGLGGTERGRIVLVDVGASAVSIIISSADDSTQAAILATAMPIVETVQFAP
jgi:hypothetical protein